MALPTTLRCLLLVVVGLLSDPARASRSVAVEQQRLMTEIVAAEAVPTVPKHVAMRQGSKECPPGGCHPIHIFRLTLALISLIFIGVFVISAFVPNLLVVMLYLAACFTIDICIAAQRSSPVSGSIYQFEPMCVVIMAEVLKLIYSASAYQAPLKEGVAGPQQRLTWESVLLFVPPAVCFAVANILTFWAMGYNDMSVFLLFRDTIVLWTAILWCLVFGTRLGQHQVMALCAVVVGLVLNRAGSLLEGNSWSWAFLWVISLTLCTALGCVLMELALKRCHALDINLQCAVFSGISLALLFPLLLYMNPARLASPKAFVLGFSRWTLVTCILQAMAGLLAARLLKCKDSVWKCVALSLRGPLMLILAATTPLLPAQIDITTFTAALFVSGGCFMYLTQTSSHSAQGGTRSLKDKDILRKASA